MLHAALQPGSTTTHLIFVNKTTNTAALNRLGVHYQVTGGAITVDSSDNTTAVQQVAFNAILGVVPATPAPTQTVTVPVTGPTYVAPPVYTPPAYSGSSVWAWEYAVVGQPSNIHIHVHSSADINSSNLAELYEGQSAGVVCSVSGPSVSSYSGTSSNWDYVTSPAVGWIADVFLQGFVPPRC